MKIPASIYYAKWALDTLGEELRSKSSLPIGHRIGAILGGFISDSWCLYELAKGDRSLYLSDYHRKKARLINGRYDIVLDDKLLFALLMGRFCRVPATIGTIDGGVFSPVLGSSSDCLTDFLEVFPSGVVLKPNRGTGGRGVHILKRGTTNSSGTTSEGTYSYHPDTKQQIEGVHIPGWKSMTACLLAVLTQIPCLKYVGWDIIMTDDGFVLLEGNNCSDVNLLQVHRPLLADSRVRAFYEHHGVTTWKSPGIAKD